MVLSHAGKAEMVFSFYKSTPQKSWNKIQKALGGAENYGKAINAN